MEMHMHAQILEWLTTAGERLKAPLRQDLTVAEKTSAKDLVTEMDHQTEEYLLGKIHQYYPDHHTIGEEGSDRSKASHDCGYLWIIDPIDGTMNFVKQKDHFAIVLAIYKDGQPLAGYIYNVMRDHCYYGWVGAGVFLNGEPVVPLEISDIRQGLVSGNMDMYAHEKYPNCRKLLDYSLGGRYNGSGALSILDVLTGRTAVYLSLGLEPWDLGAGHVLAEILGFPMTRPDGSSVDIFHKGPVIFAQPTVHQQVIEILKSGELND